MMTMVRVMMMMMMMMMMMVVVVVVLTLMLCTTITSTYPLKKQKTMRTQQSYQRQVICPHSTHVTYKTGHGEWFLGCYRSPKNFDYSQNYRIISKDIKMSFLCASFHLRLLIFKHFSTRSWIFNQWSGYLNFSKSLGLPFAASNNPYLSSSFRQSLSFNPMLTFGIVRIGPLIMHSRINFFHVIIHLSSNMVVQNSDILPGIENPAWFSLKINQL